jgi:serine/threonine protein kinase
MMDDFGFQEILDADKQEHIQQQFKVIYTRDKSKDISYSDFLLLMVLGTNALGKVVLAEHKDTGEWFALKCIRKDELRNQQKDDFDLLDIRLEDHGNTPFVEQLAYIIASKHKYFIYTNFMRKTID